LDQRKEMIKRIFKITLFIFVLLIIGAPSCVDEREAIEREELILTETKENIRKEFETEYLTETSLFAIETVAKQKLSDLADYLRIFTDTSLDYSFRAKAGEMIKNTFQSENIKLQLFDTKKKAIQEMDVAQLISMGIENKLTLPVFTFDSISIQEPIQRIANSNYSGTLRFLQNFSDSTSLEQNMNFITRTATVYVVKAHKIFGNDTLLVWGVNLGQIK